MIKSLSRLFYRHQNTVLTYGWVFGIVLFLVLLISQTLFILAFGAVDTLFLCFALMLWSVMITYFLLFRAGGIIRKSIREKMESLLEKKPLFRELTNIEDIPESKHMYANTTVDEEHVDEKESASIDDIESIAHKHGALIGNAGAKVFSKFGEETEKILLRVLGEARLRYPRFDGWLVLNNNQIHDILHSLRIPIPDELEHTEQTIEKHSDGMQENIEPPVDLPTGALHKKDTHSVASFLAVLCDANEKELFSFIRGLRAGNEKEITDFCREVILTLDSVHEHRVEGVGYIDKDVLEHTRCFSNNEIEELIAILVGSVDGRYTLPQLGIKTALLRALEYIKKSQKN